jgi:hypothetical protein
MHRSLASCTPGNGCFEVTRPGEFALRSRSVLQRPHKNIARIEVFWLYQGVSNRESAMNRSHPETVLWWKDGAS